MQQADRNENGREQTLTTTEGAEQAAVHTPETQRLHRKVVGCLLQVLALQLTLFGLLAWFVHIHPILPLDSTVSLLLNLLLKVQVGRPRPTADLVHIVQEALGYSFPSGHVMAYIAYWGLLFAFGIILFKGRHWWRTALLITSATFVMLIGPSRIYLGDHWASDVLGAYLIGEALLGLAVGVYLPLKERGVLETPEARARMKKQKALRSFPTKGGF